MQNERCLSPAPRFFFINYRSFQEIEIINYLFNSSSMQNRSKFILYVPQNMYTL